MVVGKGDLEEGDKMNDEGSHCEWPLLEHWTRWKEVEGEGL